jgi:hypothetical protein
MANNTSIMSDAYIDQFLPKDRTIMGEYIDLGRMAAQGLTLGMADEIEASVRSLTEGRPYAEVRKEIGKLLERKRKQMPLGSFATEMLGGAPTGLLGVGKTLLSTALRSGGLGATYGYMGAETGRELSEAPYQPERLPAAIGGGLISSAVGTGLQKILPTKTPEAKSLIEKGVPLTLGQAYGKKSTLAKLENIVENTIPIAGQTVGRARMNAMEGFNRAVLDEVFAPAGIKMSANKAGSELFDEAVKNYTRIWDDALEGVVIKDQRAIAEIDGLERLILQKYEGLEKADFLSKQLQLMRDRATRFGSDSARLMANYRLIRNRGFKYLKSQDVADQELGEALVDASNMFEDIIFRYAPEGKTEAYNIAKQVTQGWIPVRNAATGTAAFKQDYFTPSQLLAEIKKQASGSSVSKLFSKDMPLQEIAEAGEATIGSAPAGSQTAERMMGVSALGYLGGGQPYIPDFPSQLATTLGIAGAYKMPETTRNIATGLVIPSIQGSAVPTGGILGERAAIGAENYGLLDLPQYP